MEGRGFCTRMLGSGHEQAVNAFGVGFHDGNDISFAMTVKTAPETENENQ